MYVDFYKIGFVCKYAVFGPPNYYAPNPNDYPDSFLLNKSNHKIYQSIKTLQNNYIWSCLENYNITDFLFIKPLNDNKININLIDKCKLYLIKNNKLVSLKNINKIITNNGIFKFNNNHWLFLPTALLSSYAYCSIDRTITKTGIIELNNKNMVNNTSDWSINNNSITSTNSGTYEITYYVNALFNNSGYFSLCFMLNNNEITNSEISGFINNNSKSSQELLSYTNSFILNYTKNNNLSINVTKLDNVLLDNNSDYSIKFIITQI